MELSRHSRCHSSEHLIAAHRVLHFLYATRDQGLLFHLVADRDYRLLTYCDADHATSVTGRSVTGWIVLLGGTAVAWSSHLQAHGVARHSFEAEYFALSPAVAVTWVGFGPPGYGCPDGDAGDSM
jgi:hypothetical protein